MGVTLWGDYETERRALAQQTNQRNREASIRAQLEADRPTAQRQAELISQYRQRYPHMTGGVAVSLARAGVAADSPQAEQAAMATAKRKVRKGLGWHSIGDAVGAVGGGIGDVLGSGFVEDATSGFRFAGRVGFGALESGAQAVDAITRNTARTLSGSLAGAASGGRSGGGVEAPPTVWEQTTAGIVTEKLLKGEEVNVGSGYFPSGKTVAPEGQPQIPSVHEIQAERAREAYSINGKAGTLGRIVANVITEPGSAEYNFLSGLLDFTVDVVADPANIGLTKVSKLRAARRTLVEQEAGLLSKALHKAVDPTKVEEYLASSRGAEIRTFLRDTDDFYEIHKRMGMDMPTAARFADTASDEDVLSLLRSKLGTEIRGKPTLTTFPNVRRSLDSVRMLAEVPGQHLDPNNLPEATRALDNYFINAKVDREDRLFHVGRLARTTGPAEFFDVVDKSLGAITKHLIVNEGVDPDVARSMLTWKRNNMKELSIFHMDAAGNKVETVPTVIVDGKTIAGVPSMLPSEYLNRAVALPDYREIRKYASALTTLRTNGVVDFGVSGLDFIFGRVWKDMALFRAAWTVRVLADEQLRLGATFGGNPIEMIRWAIGNRGAIKEFRTASEAADGLDEFARAGYQRRSTPFAPGERERLAMIGHRQVSPGDPHYFESLADELLQLNGDDLARRMTGGWSAAEHATGELSGNDFEDAFRWWWAGDGKRSRLDLAEARGLGALADDPQFVRQWMKASIDDRIAAKTNLRPDLLEVVRSGKVNGKPIRDVDKLRPSKELIAYLRKLTAEGEDFGIVKGKAFAEGGKTNKFFQGLRTAEAALFDGLMGRPSTYLSRNPTWARFYWQRVEEMIPNMTREAQVRALQDAKAANLSRKTLQRMAGRMNMRTGNLGWDDVDADDVFEIGADTIAKGYGLDETRRLMYDLSQRSQFFDITRIIFPFGEAWKELIQTWAKIGWQHPEKIERFRQVVEGARGSGFFYTDENGQERFNYPGSEWITQQALGVPIPLGGTVQGLNMFSSNPIVPGLGPVPQMALSRALPDKPSFNAVRKFLMPFGDPTKDPEGGFIESFYPAWIKKLQTFWDDPESNRLLMNTKADMATYLLSTGDYSLDSPEDVRALEDAAESKAKWFGMIRAAAQFVSPTAPSPEFVVKDVNGDALVMNKVIERYYELQKEVGYDKAMSAFMSEFGDAAGLLVQPRTQDVAIRTKPALEFLQTHPNIARDYPDTYRYFVPQGGDFDFDAYRRGLREGKARTLTYDEMVTRANNRVASAIYKEQKAKLGDKPTDAQRAWLRDVNARLMQKYPGYGDVSSGPKLDAKISELVTAIADPDLADTDVAIATREYLAARKRANDAVQGTLVNINKAESAKKYRDWLRAVGVQLSERYPAFFELYENLLSRELKDDAPAEAAAA